MFGVRDTRCDHSVSRNHTLWRSQKSIQLRLCPYERRRSRCRRIRIPRHRACRTTYKPLKRGADLKISSRHVVTTPTRRRCFLTSIEPSLIHGVQSASYLSVTIASRRPKEEAEKQIKQRGSPERIRNIQGKSAFFSHSLMLPLPIRHGLMWR